MELNSILSERTTEAIGKQFEVNIITIVAWIGRTVALIVTIAVIWVRTDDRIKNLEEWRGEQIAITQTLSTNQQQVLINLAKVNAILEENQRLLVNYLKDGNESKRLEDHPDTSCSHMVARVVVSATFEPDEHLKSQYLLDSLMYFKGRLPSGVLIGWDDLDNDDGITLFDNGRPFVIAIDRRLQETPGLASCVLNHEEVHASLPQSINHGPRFTAKMMSMLKHGACAGLTRGGD